MTEKQKKQVERVMDGWQAGYAYLEPMDGSARQEFVFDMTSENIANFIGAHQFDAGKITLTDMLDRKILDTCGGFIDHCPDQNRCEEIKKILIPIQIGETEAKDIVAVERGVFEEYCALEEQAVADAEITMM